jgi:hypothetical protein
MALASACRKYSLVYPVRFPRFIDNAQVCFLMLFAEMMRFDEETEQQSNARECGILLKISMKGELKVD